MKEDRSSGPFGTGNHWNPTRCLLIAFAVIAYVCVACSPAATTIAAPGYYRYDSVSYCAEVVISSDDVIVDMIGTAVSVRSSSGAALRNVTIRVSGLRDVLIAATPLVELSAARHMEAVHVSVRDCVNITLRNTPLIDAGSDVGQFATLSNVSFEIQNVSCVAELANGDASGSPSLLRAVIVPVLGGISAALTPTTVRSLLVDPVMSGAVTSYSQGVRVIVRRVWFTVGSWRSRSRVDTILCAVELKSQTGAGVARDVYVVMEEVQLASCAVWHRQPTVDLSWLGEWCDSSEVSLQLKSRYSASTLLQVPRELSLLRVDATDGVLLNFSTVISDATMYSSVSSLVFVMKVMAAALINSSADLTRITLKASIVVAPAAGNFAFGMVYWLFGVLLSDNAIKSTHVSIRGFLCSGLCLWDTMGMDSSSLESVASNLTVVSCVAVAIESLKGTNRAPAAHRTTIMLENVTMENDISYGVEYNPNVIGFLTPRVTYAWSAQSSSLISARMDSVDLVISVANSISRTRQLDMRMPSNLPASTFATVITCTCLVSIPPVVNTTSVTVTDSSLILDALNVTTGGRNASVYVALVMSGGAGDADLLRFLRVVMPEGVLRLLGIDFNTMAASRGIDVANGLQRDVLLTTTRSVVDVGSAAQMALCDRQQLQAGMLPSLHQSVSLLNPISDWTVNATYVVQDCIVLCGSVLSFTKQPSVLMESTMIVVRNVSSGTLVQAVGGSAVVWRNVTLRVEGSTVRLAVPGAAAAAMVVPNAAVFGLGWPEVEGDGTAVKTAKVTMIRSRVSLCGSIFAGYGSVLQRDVTAASVDNVVELCGCNGFVGNASASSSGGVAIVEPLLADDAAALGVERAVAVPSWTVGPVAAGAANLNCAGVVSPTVVLHETAWAARLLAGLAAAGSALILGGVDLGPLQMNLRMSSSLSCSAPDASFQGDPVSNPLQMGALWMLSSNSTAGCAGIPKEARNAVGAVVGACVLMVMCSVLSTATVAIRLRRQLQRRNPLLSVIRQAFHLAGGWTSSYRDAYVMLQPSLVASGTGLLLHAMISSGEAYGGDDGGIWLVSAGAVGVLIGLAPLLYWSWFVLQSWMDTTAFPFRLKYARRSRRPIQRIVCVDATVRALLGTRRVYHLKRPDELRRGGAALREAVAYRAVVEAYVEKRRWFFVVEGALNASGGVLGGVSWAASWCGVQPAAAALCLSVASMCAVVFMRPHVSQWDFFLSVLASGAAVVSGSLLVAAGGESPAAADVALWSTVAVAALGLFCGLLLRQGGRSAGGRLTADLVRYVSASHESDKPLHHASQAARRLVLTHRVSSLRAPTEELRRIQSPALATLIDIACRAAAGAAGDQLHPTSQYCSP